MRSGPSTILHCEFGSSGSPIYKLGMLLLLSRCRQLVSDCLLLAMILFVMLL